MALYKTYPAHIIFARRAFAVAAGVLALPVIGLYNGQRGRSQSVNRVMKWLFYIYYPLHLFVIGLIIR